MNKHISGIGQQKKTTTVFLMHTVSENYRNHDGFAIDFLFFVFIQFLSSHANANVHDLQITFTFTGFAETGNSMKL